MRNPLTPAAIALAGVALVLDILGALLAWALLPDSWT